MEYKLVTVEQKNLYDAKERLMSDVNFLLKKGWQLQGGVSISCHMIGYAEYYNLAQALVRREDKPTKNNDVQVTLL